MAAPRNRFGDRLLAFVDFYLIHKRLPKNELIFNDVLYKIKTTDEILDPLRVFISDKEFVKIFIKATIGDQYNVPTLAVLKSAEEIDAFEFPESCCIKPTHASGQVILRRNGESIDKQRIKNWFCLNYYDVGREANYKHLKPKVIVEPLIFEGEGGSEYRFYCYNGKPGFVGADVDEISNRFYDTNWNDLGLSITAQKSPTGVARPENFEEMLLAATRLSARFSLIRVDFYSTGKRFYVGEMTNCHRNATGVFNPIESERTASQLLFRNAR